jgi:hypothetical protein
MRKFLIAAALLAGSLVAAVLPAHAQNTTGLVLTTCGSPVVAFRANNPGPFTVNTAGQLCVTGSISASLGGYNPETFLTPFTATTAGVSSSAFTAGKTIVVSNAGTTNTAYCRLGAASTTAAQPILPGSWFAFTSIAETQVTCATSTSTTTINVAVGTGLPTGAGGGGGSGGGGAVTMASGAVASGAYSSGSIASGAMVDLGSQADAACGTDTGTCSAVALIKRGNQTATSINTNVQAAVPAGTNLIGKVGIDQTTPGTTNAVSVPLRTAGGWTPSRLSALSTTVTAIKSSAAGSLGMLVCGNPNASIIFIQVFDVATAGGVTLGTTAPTLSFQVDASSSIGFALPVNGMAFANGIQVAATTTATGNTAPGTAANCNAGFN